MSERPLLLSPSAIALLVEVTTGGVGNVNAPPPIGVYRTATELRRLFAMCDVDFDQRGLSRTDAVHAHLQDLNTDPGQHNTIIRLIETLADPLQYHQAPDNHPAVLEALNRVLAPAGREVVHLPPSFPKVHSRGMTAPVAAALQAHAEALSLDTVQRDLRRAVEQADSDPEDALTSACSLLESVCRTILSRMGKTLPKERHLRPLADATRDALGLATPRSDLPPLVAQDVNQVLTGLTSAINGVASLRTHAGDAHGREAGHPRVDPRIARLGINAAGTLALFLVETWQRRGTASTRSS